jgi:hypothetical protein
MNLNSKYFDRIRINPGGSRVETEETTPPCEWQGCGRAGGYRAPKGRLREGEYHNFCLDHVREYNKTYNYFAGMADDDVAAYQRSASIGHRPTWSMGVDREDRAAFANARTWSATFSDPFGVFSGSFRHEAPKPEAEAVQRPLRKLEERSFKALDLEGTESGPEIKARYKALVKLLHPDANGGDRSSEDRLRQIIQAYHYLRSVGFC